MGRCAGSTWLHCALAAVATKASSSRANITSFFMTRSPLPRWFFQRRRVCDGLGASPAMNLRRMPARGHRLLLHLSAQSERKAVIARVEGRGTAPRRRGRACHPAAAAGPPAGHPPRPGGGRACRVPAAAEPRAGHAEARRGCCHLPPRRCSALARFGLFATALSAPWPVLPAGRALLPADLERRARLGRPLVRLVLVMTAGAATYGAALGVWHGGRQALYAAVKLPLVLVLTSALTLLFNWLVGPILRLRPAV